MSNSLVSVVIPVYNGENYISDSIESVLSQSYRPIEIIVVDDGSTDGTKDVLKQYSEVIYIHQENSGPSRARNKGIRQSKGEYITFLDCDDLWPSAKLEIQVKLMEENTDIALLFGDVQLFTEDGILIASMFAKRELNQQYFGDPLYVCDAYKKLLLLNFIPTGSVMIRKKCLNKTGLFDEDFRYVEDRELWIRIAMHYPIGYSKEILELKRCHLDNRSDNVEATSPYLINILEKQEREFNDYLTKHDIDLSTHFMEACSNLGYYYLTKNQLVEARAWFRRSLKRGIRLRTLIYWLSTFFSVSFVKTIRRLRE